MSFFEVAGHPLIYIMVSIGIVFIAGLAMVSMRKSWKRALAKGYSREKLMTIVKATVSATIVPSFAIVIGFFALVPILGVPWPWWRLSVVGAVTYETMAANAAVIAGGLDLAHLADAGAMDFVLVMFVMSIGIMGGLCISPFISKKIQEGTMKIKQGDKRWGALGSSVFFMVICAVFTVPWFLDYSKVGLTRLLTFATSIVITLVLDVIATRGKQAWLKAFELAIALIVSMASSLCWSGLLTAIMG
jgi:hypothetical protein